MGSKGIVILETSCILIPDIIDVIDMSFLSRMSLSMFKLQFRTPK